MREARERRRLSVAVVTPQLRRYGGSEVYLLECLRRWQEQVSITLYTPDLSRRLLREFGVDGVATVKLPSALDGSRGQRLLEDSVLLPQLWEAHIAPHDVYFLYLVPTQMIRRRPAVWFAAEPMRMIYDLRHHNHADDVVDVHFYPKVDYDRVAQPELDVLLSLIERIDAPVCDRLATNSRAMAGYLRNVYGRSADRVVHPGVDLSVAVTPPSRSRTILSVGKLWRHKRVDLAVRALALLPGASLVVAGEGPERRPLQRLASDLGVAGRVRFAGAVRQEELRRLYAQATCCIYTSVREPFGMVPLEAAAAGRPVVATLGAGVAEVLGDAAISVPARPEDLAAAIRPILADPDLAARLGERARHAVEGCTWDRTASTLLELFHEAAAPVAAANGRRSRRVHAPQVGAHYYPWYHAGRQPRHWNENPELAAVTDLPLGGPYSSNRTSLLRRHLRMAADHGIDFFVVNWQVAHDGVHPGEKAATRKLFRLVEEEEWPVRLSILLAVQTEDWAVVEDAALTVVEELVPSPAYQRVRSRPPFWWFLNGPFLGHFFYDHARLVAATAGCSPIAAAGIAYSRFLPRLVREYFDGWCLYSPLQVASAGRREVVWRDTYRAFHDDGGRIRIVSLSPGYDDTPLRSAQRRGTAHRNVGRHGTRTYQAMQAFALDAAPPPHLAVITSFNEFHENTHIEPSERFGTAHLESTREFSRKVKAARR